MRISGQVNFTRKNEAHAFKYESHNLLQRSGIIKKLPSSEIAFSSLGSYYFCFFEELLVKSVLASRGYVRVISSDPEDFIHNEVRSVRNLNRGVYSSTQVENDDFTLGAGLFRPKWMRRLSAISYFEGDEESRDHSDSTLHGVCAIIPLSERVLGVMGHKSVTLAYEDECGTMEALRCASCGRVSDPHSLRVSYEKIPSPDAIDIRDDASFGRKAVMVYTPDVRTIDDVSSFFDEPKSMILKTVVVQSAGAYLAVLMSGERELSLRKLALSLGVGERSVSLVPRDRVEGIFGVKPGFIGPLYLPDHVRIIADESVIRKKPSICGGGEDDYHCSNVEMGRDYKVHLVGDVSCIDADDVCASCGGNSAQKVTCFPIARIAHGKADGSESLLKSSYMGGDGVEAVPHFSKVEVFLEPMISAIFETHAKDGVIVMPGGIAPFVAGVCPVSDKDETVKEAAEAIYAKLQASGVRSYLNDSSERAGIKFNLDDKLGNRFRITVGKSASEGMVELKDKTCSDVHIVAINDAVEMIIEACKSD
jgi:prolyl-tRNA synthetase